MDLCRHLKQRHLDLNLHTAWMNSDGATVQFPIYSPITWKMVGQQTYRPGASKEKRNDPRDGKYFTRGNKENPGLWGFESWYLSKTLFICEGLFDAARLTDRGYSAIACLSNNPKHLKNWFFLTGIYRRTVAVCDHGSAGILLAKYGNEYHVMPEEFDMGAAPDEYVTKFLENYR